MKDWTPQQLLAIMKIQPLDFEPGQKAQYTNSGYILLGLIIEKITGISYSDFVEQHITKPLGMSNTMMGSNSNIIPRRAAGYFLLSKNLKNAEIVSLSSPYASGGLMSTPTDLVKLRKAFMPGGLLKQKSMDEMIAPARFNNGQEYVNVTGTGFDFTYGYGMDMLKRGNEIIPGKTGSISGFTSYFAHYRDRGLTIVVLSNLANSLFDLLEIARGIAGTSG
jgi:CubicO group peptidase (beta-lactamase class C family)